MTTTAVVICTHLESRLEQLKAAVASVESQTRPPDEIIVAVDGTPDLEHVVRQALPHIRVIGMGYNQGLSHARNSAVAAVEARVILFLDDDAVAEPEWVERLSDAVAAPVLGASGRSEPLWVGARPAWLPDEFLWIIGCSYKGQPNIRQEVRNVYGGCCALRRELFTELGGYDEGLGKGSGPEGGGEEAELCLRARERWPDARFVHEPGASIRHRVPADRLTWSYGIKRAFGEGVVKARLAKGSSRALSPERSFASALPAAVGFELVQGLRGRRGSFSRVLGLVGLSAAVLAGLAAGSLRSGR